MWRGHPFSQRNKKTAGGRRLEVADRGVGQNLKNVDWKYRGGVFITYWVLGALC